MLDAIVPFLAHNMAPIMFAALVLFLLAAWEGLLRGVRNLIGAGSEASTLYFFGLLFVVALLLHFSVRVSRLERRVNSMLQEIALLGAASRNGKHNGAGDISGQESDEHPGVAPEDELRASAGHEGAER